MFVDTHCHLNMLVKKDEDAFLQENDYQIIEEKISEAQAADVKRIITIGTSVNESINSVNIAKRFEDVYAVVGLHPCDCAINWKDDFVKIKELIKNKASSFVKTTADKENKIVGIGETGLDFFHKPFDKERQIEAFRLHIELAIENNLPVVVHVRESAEEVLKVLQDYKKEIKGVIHCFSQKKDFADEALKLGLYLGINGPITYPKNEWFRNVVRQLPLESLLLETDAPFLPPQKLRGKQNLPAYIPIIAQAIADIKNIDVKEVGDVTTLNAQKLFGIK